MILNITKMSHNEFTINIYDECEKCEMPKNPYHDKHGCPKEVEEDDCCKTCEQTDIEICYDCGECADPSLPNRCCECEEEELTCLGFRPQSRIGECEGCKAVCEECENLMITVNI